MLLRINSGNYGFLMNKFSNKLIIILKIQIDYNFSFRNDS